MSFFVEKNEILDPIEISLDRAFTVMPHYHVIGHEKQLVQLPGQPVNIY